MKSNQPNLKHKLFRKKIPFDVTICQKRSPFSLQGLQSHPGLARAMYLYYQVTTLVSFNKTTAFQNNFFELLFIGLTFYIDSSIGNA